MPAAIPLRLALFYAAIFAMTGVLLPFWPVWLAARGLAPQEIAALLAVGQWIKVATNPLAGLLADRSGDRRRVMALLSAGLLAGYLLCLPTRGFVSLMLLNAAIGACIAALIPLGDNVALAAAYAGRLDYGRVRVWGTVGFILATLASGRILEGRSAELVLHLALGAAALTAASCVLLPPAESPLRVPARPVWRHLMAPRHLAFIAAATLIQTSHSVYYAFGTLRWQALGFSNDAIAWLWAEGAIAEVVLFSFNAPLLRRLGPLGLLALGGGAGLVRWTVTASATTLPVLALVQWLHALTFGAAHLGAMHYLARRIPAEHSATGQAFYTATVGGLGSGLVTLASGALYGALGPASYLAMAALAALGALAAALLARRDG